MSVPALLLLAALACVATAICTPRARRRGVPEGRRPAVGPDREPLRDEGRGRRRGRAISVPASSVVRVEEGARRCRSTRSAPAHLAAGDAAGWLALAQWAEAKGLGSQAREAYHRVLAASP